MTDHEGSPDTLLIAEALPVRIGRPLLAWVVIVALVVLAAGLRHIRPFIADPTRDDQASVLVMQMQAQYLVGAAHTVAQPDENLYAQAKALNTGSVGQRLRYVVVAGELAGPTEALEQLHQLDVKLAEQAITPTANQLALRDILGRLYRDYEQKEFAAPSVREAERDLLRQRYGWFGELALVPAGTPDEEARAAILRSAERTLWVLFGSVGGFLVVGFAGLVGLVVFLILAALRHLRGGIRSGVPHGGVYAETFAVWMALFMALSYAGSWLPLPASSFLLSGIAMLLSLGALAWPVLRGIPWREVRREIGLTAGRQPGLEPLIGFGGYAMALPLMGIGMILTLLLVSAQKVMTGGAPDDHFHTGEGLQAHPILALMASPSWWDRIQALILVSVIAPIVEETMFRGVLYRHLREASARLGFVGSFLTSAVLVSFIFAVIHPQGVLAVPGLAALALAFTLVREWRGTLIPGMVAHAINNGVLMLLVLLTLG